MSDKANYKLKLLITGPSTKSKATNQKKQSTVSRKCKEIH